MPAYPCISHMESLSFEKKIGSPNQSNYCTVNFCLNYIYIEIILKLYWIISNHILNYIQYLFCKRSAMLLSGSGRGEHCTGLVAWNLGKWTGAERAERRAERPGTIDAIDAIDVAVAGTARCWETSDLLGSELSHPMSHHKEGFCRFPGELPILLDREPRFRPCASQTWHLLPRA